MARKASALVGRVMPPAANSERSISPEERHRMIQEAAYYLYVRRGSGNGHDLEDWLAAEAELGRMSEDRQAAQVVEMPEFGVQQSSVHGFRQDEALKRIIRQHPQRGIPQVEGMETKEAPVRE